MNISILINSTGGGGAENIVKTLFVEFSKDKSPIELICIEKNDVYTMPSNINVTYLSNFNGSENQFIKLMFIPILAWKLKTHIAKNNINLVQSHLYRSNYINVLAKLFGAKHQVQIVNHAIVSRFKEEFLSGKINLVLVRYLYSHANLIICISKVMLSDMRKLFQFENRQIVIHNPFNMTEIKKQSDAIVENFEFLPYKKYIVTVGRLIPLKRIETILQALKNLDTDIELILVGDGQEKDNLLLLAKELGIANRVNFVGWVENPYTLIAKSTIFVMASESESFANVVVEAMICGIPVISSDCGGPREILAPDSEVDFQLKKGSEYSKYGVLYAIGDVEALVESIQKLLDDAKLYKHYAIAGQERANDFSVKKIIKQYKDVLCAE